MEKQESTPKKPKKTIVKSKRKLKKREGHICQNKHNTGKKPEDC